MRAGAQARNYTGKEQKEASSVEGELVVVQLGYKGTGFGGNCHFLDAMIILKPIWEDDEGKYARVDEIKCCWWKANIQPVSLEYDINNDVRRSHVPIRMKILKKYYCDNIYDFL